MIVSFVDERVLLVRDAWDVSSCFAVVVVAGPVAPTCAREGRVDGVQIEMSRRKLRWRAKRTGSDGSPRR